MQIDILNDENQRISRRMPYRSIVVCLGVIVAVTKMAEEMPKISTLDWATDDLIRDIELMRRKPRRQMLN
jgi:hypothetical protein